MSKKDVAYALSTWKKSKGFNAGVKELAQQIPLSEARLYLVSGVKDPRIPDAIYERIDELQNLRKAGIQSEMRYVLAQAYLYSQEDPELAIKVIEQNNLEHVLANSQTDDAHEAAMAALKSAWEKDDEQGQGNRSNTAALIFGDDVITGDNIRFGFGTDELELGPSLGVYELFIWFDVDEVAH